MAPFFFFWRRSGLVSDFESGANQAPKEDAGTD
jgi:hypothetical protein